MGNAKQKNPPPKLCRVQLRLAWRNCSTADVEIEPSGKHESDWRGIQSDGCARIPWGARAERSAIQAIAATLVLAAVLTLFVPSVRAAAATALDFLSLKLDDSRQVVLEGKLICRDCQLEKEYGYHAMCPLTGHHGWLQTSDGRLWGILEGNASEELIHNSSLLGRRVKIQGRIFRKAGSIAVSGYELL